jgi:hypothetical protein
MNQCTTGPGARRRPSDRGARVRLIPGIAAFDHALDDVCAEAACSQKAHLTRTVGPVKGGRVAKLSGPDRPGTGVFGAAEFRCGLRIQGQPMLTELGLDAAVAETRGAGLHPGFDEPVFTEQALGLQFIQQPVDLGGVHGCSTLAGAGLYAQELAPQLGPALLSQGQCRGP